MPGYESGLHRQIPSISDGAPVPEDGGSEGSSYIPTSADSKSPLTESPTPVEQIPPVLESQQSYRSVPEAASVKGPKTDSDWKVAIQVFVQRIWEQIESRFFAQKPGVSVKRQKVMAILVPVLFAVLVIILIRAFTGASPKASRARSPEPAGVVADSIEIDWQIPASYPTTLRDPMRFEPVTGTQARTGGIIVKGIVHSEDGSAVVIGNQIMHEGEKVSGATIVKINKDSVEFEMNGKVWMQKVRR